MAAGLSDRTLSHTGQAMSAMAILRVPPTAPLQRTMPVCCNDIGRDIGARLDRISDIRRAGSESSDRALRFILKVSSKMSAAQRRGRVVPADRAHATHWASDGLSTLSEGWCRWGTHRLKVVSVPTDCARATYSVHCSRKMALFGGGSCPPGRALPNDRRHRG